MDIVTRLREGRTNGTDLRWQVTDLHIEAADEIERLRAALKKIGELTDVDCDTAPTMARMALAYEQNTIKT